MPPGNAQLSAGLRGEQAELTGHPFGMTDPGNLEGVPAAFAVNCRIYSNCD